MSVSGRRSIRGRLHGEEEVKGDEDRLDCSFLFCAADSGVLGSRSWGPSELFLGQWRLMAVLVISHSLRRAWDECEERPEDERGVKKRLKRLGVIGGGRFGLPLVRGEVARGGLMGSEGPSW
jgi:hypothetical protein